MARGKSAAILVVLLAAIGLGRGFLFFAFGDMPFGLTAALTPLFVSLLAIEVVAHLVVAGALGAGLRWAPIASWVLSGVMLSSLIPGAAGSVAIMASGGRLGFTTDSALVAAIVVDSVAIVGYVVLVFLAVRIQREHA